MAVFELCKTYGLDQYRVFDALGFDMNHYLVDTCDTMMVEGRVIRVAGARDGEDNILEDHQPKENISRTF